MLLTLLFLSKFRFIDLATDPMLPRLRSFTPREHDFVDRMLAKQELYGRVDVKDRKLTKPVCSSFSTVGHGRTLGSTIAQQSDIYGRIESTLLNKYAHETSQQRPNSPANIKLKKGLSVIMTHYNMPMRRRRSAAGRRRHKADVTHAPASPSRSSSDDGKTRLLAPTSGTRSPGGGSVGACACRTDQSPWMKGASVSGKAMDMGPVRELPKHIRKNLVLLHTSNFSPFDK